MRNSSAGGSSPEDIMRKVCREGCRLLRLGSLAQIFLRWINFRLERDGGAPMRDLTDLFRTENLVRITELVLGRAVDDANYKPRMEENHARNVDLCVSALGAKTKLEWGAAKLIKGVQAKQLGYLEILCWHLVEVGELAPMGLPTGTENLAPLSKAIEGRLSNFISLKQFHFRFTKEMIFDIVHDCSSWSPDAVANDVQNLRSAFDNMANWGIPLLVDPPDVRSMGSVNERGFLMFFAMFIPSLEGTAGPKKTAAVAPPPVVVMAADTSHLDAQLAQLRAELAAVQGQLLESRELRVEAEQRSESLAMAVDAKTSEANELRARLAGLESSMNNEASARSTQLSAAQQEVARLTQQLEQQGRAASENAALLQERDAELASSRAETEQLHARLQDASTDTQRALDAQHELREQLRDARGQLQRCQRECESLTEQLDASGAQSASDVQRLQRERDAKIEEIQQVRTELETALDRIASQDFDGLERKFKTLLTEFGAVTLNLKEARMDNERLTKSMHALELKMPLFARQGKNNVPPPTGDVTLCFTDVEGSTVQWEWNADAMAVAIRVHNDLMRTKLEAYQGYEVKTEGDAFMVAFADPLAAVSWCLDVQEALLHAKWPETLYEHPKSQLVMSATNQLLYKGLRVRMGIHTGKPSAEEDPVTGRMDYFGPMVNRSARVESVANGGQIVMSSDVHERVASIIATSKWAPEILDLGVFELKGLNDPTHILQILPRSLCERKFEAVKSKESELADEKKKLEEQLKELQSKNDEMASRLQGIDNEVASQMVQAKKLLSDVQAAKTKGLPPAEMLATLRDQLTALLDGQTVAATELQRAKAVNDELFRQADEMASRREAIAVQTIVIEKEALESKVSTLKYQLEQARDRQNALDAELRSMQAEAQTAENRSMSLQTQNSSLQSLQKAMAVRIEALERDLEEASSKYMSVGVMLKTESDRWAQEERVLKANIRSLEERLTKRDNAKTQEEHSSRLETMALRQSLREAEAELERLRRGQPSLGSAPAPTAAAVPVSGRAEHGGGSSRIARSAQVTQQYDVCYNCDLPISSGVKVTAVNRRYHEECFACGKCGKVFSPQEKFYEERGRAVHDQCRE